MNESQLIKQNSELIAALQAIIKEAGAQMGLDDGPGSVNRIARVARQAVASIGSDPE